MRQVIALADGTTTDAVTRGPLAIAVFDTWMSRETFAVVHVPTGKVLVWCEAKRFCGAGEARRALRWLLSQPIDWQALTTEQNALWHAAKDAVRMLKISHAPATFTY